MSDDILEEAKGMASAASRNAYITVRLSLLLGLIAEIERLRHALSSDNVREKLNSTTKERESAKSSEDKAGGKPG